LFLDLQTSAGTRPLVRDRVDDDAVVAGSLGSLDRLNEPLGLVRCFEVQHVEVELAGVQAGAAALGVDHGDLAELRRQREGSGGLA
jgi:hypothetical protein